ncbi:transmembrane protein 121B [Hemiscyllium ocellatum]|uniref:transmembrane protein 121B n=1 Tax=Hemiscyllium ocellatum TaxID=170820 RepID=UPI0029666BCD|nr:transmembrane protein 121B [Hemiscyllium ocellatum]
MSAAPGNESSRSAAPAPSGGEGHPRARDSDPLFIRNSSFRRNSQTSTASLSREIGAASSIKAPRPAFIITSGEFLQHSSDCNSSPGPHSTTRTLFYKGLCLLLLLCQGGLLDFYLIIFTDLYWCSWIATDLVVMVGWLIFFIKHSRRRADAAKAAPDSGQFAFSYLAWLIYVIACTPKIVLILETSILDLIELKVPLGTTGFKMVVLSSVPLLYTLINSVTEELSCYSSHRAQHYYSRTCLDLLDSFTLMELLLAGHIPSVYLKYTVTAVYFVAFFVPVLWLYELNSLQLHYKCVVFRFVSSSAVNAPLLVVRCFLVFIYDQQVSVFLLKNVFWLCCDCAEVLERCCSVRRVRKYSSPPVQFTHCISENEMCAHGYVNTLAVTAQS